jgi:hypothetical protein
MGWAPLLSRWRERWLRYKAQRRASDGDLRVEGDAFALHEYGSGQLLWRIDLAEIDRVMMYKMDLWAVDLVCCQVFLSGEREAIVFHEEMRGFTAVMTLLHTLPGFRQDWWDAVVHPAFATNLTVVFERDPGASGRASPGMGRRLGPAPVKRSVH